MTETELGSQKWAEAHYGRGNHMGFGDETDTEYEEREETKNDSRFLFEII